MEEVWKDIKGYEGKYKISNLGRILMSGIHSNGRKYGEKIKKTRVDKNGYEYANLTDWEGNVKTRKIHQLVACAFIPNTENKPCIDHIDCNRTNNNVSNLRWVTHKENANNPLTKKHLSEALIEACKSQEYREQRRMSAMLPKNMEARLAKVLRPVLKYTKNGLFIKEFPSISDAAREVNGNVTSITRNCKGRRPSAYGYVWKYKD